MIQADKQLIQSQLKLSSLKAVGTVAALLAGFAISALQNNVSQPFWPLSVFFHMVFPVAIMYNLSCVCNSTFISMFGPGLALRGKDGSMHKAVEGMMAERIDVFNFFRFGIVALHVAMAAMIFSWRSAHFLGWLDGSAVSLMLGYSLYKITGYTNRIRDRFEQHSIEGRRIAGILDSRLYADPDKKRQRSFRKGRRGGANTGQEGGGSKAGWGMRNVADFADRLGTSFGTRFRRLSSLSGASVQQSRASSSSSSSAAAGHHPNPSSDGHHHTQHGQHGNGRSGESSGAGRGEQPPGDKYRPRSFSRGAAPSSLGPAGIATEEVSTSSGERAAAAAAGGAGAGLGGAGGGGAEGAGAAAGAGTGGPGEMQRLERSFSRGETPIGIHTTALPESVSSTPLHTYNAECSSPAGFSPGRFDCRFDTATTNGRNSNYHPTRDHQHHHRHRSGNGSRSKENEREQELAEQIAALTARLAEQEATLQERSQRIGGRSSSRHSGDC